MCSRIMAPTLWCTDLSQMFLDSADCQVQHPFWHLINHPPVRSRAFLQPIWSQAWQRKGDMAADLEGQETGGESSRGKEKSDKQRGRREKDRKKGGKKKTGAGARLCTFTNNAT